MDSRIRLEGIKAIMEKMPEENKNNIAFLFQFLKQISEFDFRVV